MADLITHMASGLLVKGATRGRYTGALVAGTVLPDLGARVPAMGFSALAKAGVPVPPEVPYAFEVLHMPVGMLLMCVVLALLFIPEQRQGVFINLVAGCFLHLGVDLLQDHLGVGYLLAFPFSTWDFELGWMGSEATVYLAPLFGAASLGFWWWRMRGSER
ncbi:MAG: hypothetical protein VXW32_07140 [Myxococcota bacterium]|nr:hypothetical protein [Myxococcota bacterium]